MENANLRNAVKKHVDRADIKLLKMIKALAESYEEDNQYYVVYEKY